MQRILTPVKVIINEKTLKFELGDDTIVYYDDVNAFMENTGLTIQNVELTQLKAYYLKLGNSDKTFACGGLFDNLVLRINQEVDNVLLIIDFKDVEEASESLLKSYTEFLLTTKNKVITINMNIQITTRFGMFIENNIKDIKEIEEEPPEETIFINQF